MTDYTFYRKAIVAGIMAIAGIVALVTGQENHLNQEKVDIFVGFVLAIIPLLVFFVPNKRKPDEPKKGEGLPLSIFLIPLLLVGVVSCAKPQPPPIPPDAEMKIYQTFYQIESKYNTSYDLIVGFTRVTATATNAACKGGVKSICDAGNAYRKFYDEKLKPASAQATKAYMAAVSAWQAYRAGTGSEADVNDKLNALVGFISNMESLYAQGQQVAAPEGMQQ